MELVEVDALDPEPAQRGFGLLADRLRLQDPSRLRHRMALVPHEAAFGEHQWPLPGVQLAQQAAHDLFGMTEAVYRRRIDPVDAQLEGASHRGSIRRRYTASVIPKRSWAA